MFFLGKIYKIGKYLPILTNKEKRIQITDVRSYST